MFAVQNSILDKDRHKRLIEDMPHVCATANVPQHFVHQSMKGVATESDIDWVVNFNAYRSKGLAGLALVGVKSPETRMMAICGALLRNFIDARVLPLNTLLALHEKGVLADPTVMFIPNLYLRSATGSQGLPQWKVHTIYDILLNRFSSGKTTVVFAEDMDALGMAYGQVFKEHLTQNYKVVCT